MIHNRHAVHYRHITNRRDPSTAMLVISAVLAMFALWSSIAFLFSL